MTAESLGHGIIYFNSGTLYIARPAALILAWPGAGINESVKMQLEP